MRYFVFETSVYKNYKFDTQDKIDLAFLNDIEKTKIRRFVKDSEDLKNTYKVIRKHYVEITHQYLINI